MQVISLISDYGNKTYYAAALKAKLLSVLPNAILVDISHNLPAFDLIQTAFLLQSCLPDFTHETVHLIAVDTNLDLHKQVLVGKLNNHWFITVDNGILSMISDSWDAIYTVKNIAQNSADLSPEKSVFTAVAAKLFSAEPKENYLTVTTPNVVVNNLKPVVEPNQIRATIVHVDGYDNAVSNLTKTDFENWIGADNYIIHVKGRTRIQSISINYTNAQPGDAVAVFNERGWLEVAMNRGNGSSLLGLKLGDQIIIEKLND